MVCYTLCVLFLLLCDYPGVYGRLSPIWPDANSVYSAGETVLVAWSDDAHRPSLEDTGPMRIDLCAGNSTPIGTLADGVLPSARTVSVSIPSDLPFKLADYTLRFTTNIPPMTISSSSFILVSASGPSIVVEPDDIPASPFPRTVTVTRTTVISPPPQPVATMVVTLTRLAVGPTQAAFASEPPLVAVDSTFLELVDGSLQLATDTVLQQDIPPAITTVRAYPIFLSRVTSPSSAMDASIPTSFLNGTLTASGSSTALLPTNVAKPSSLKSSHASSSTVRSPLSFHGSLLISVIFLMAL